MSGKYIVAALIAASSTSAATIGVVYTRLADAGHEAPAIAVDKGSAPLQSAVVLNASESLFEHESADTADPVCPNESQGCVMVMRSSDTRLKILGYTITIPPLWLGGNSEDQYGAASNRSWLANELPDIEFLMRPGLRRASAAKTDDAQGDSQSGSQDASTTDGAEDTTSGQTISPSATDAPATDGLTMNKPLSTFPTTDLSRDVLAAGLAEFGPELQGGPGAPEPSTWLMLLTGMATLGVFRRRALASIFTSLGRRVNRAG